MGSGLAIQQLNCSQFSIRVLLHILSFGIPGDYRSTCSANCNPLAQVTLDRMLRETERVYCVKR